MPLLLSNCLSGEETEAREIEKEYIQFKHDQLLITSGIKNKRIDMIIPEKKR